MSKIAFIGLGTLGYPLAGHLQQSHQVTVYNRTTEKAEKWVAEYQGRMAASPAEAAQDADVVLTCVGNDDDVRDVVLGTKGALAGMRTRAVLIDHTTASPSLAKELAAACQQQQIDFMDAPVSGGAEGAKNACLTIMCGATPDVFQQWEPLLACYGRKVTHIGAIGSGQAAKMINQVCVVGVLQSLAEGLKLAQDLSLDVPKVMEAISQGAAGSWQMQHRWQSMLEGDFSPKFSNRWMAKDLAICLKEAEAQGTPLPSTRLIDSFYRQLVDDGKGELDITSLLARLG